MIVYHEGISGGPFPDAPHFQLTDDAKSDWKRARQTMLDMSVGAIMIFPRTIGGKSLFAIIDALNAKDIGGWINRRQGRLNAIKRVG